MGKVSNLQHSVLLQAPLDPLLFQIVQHDAAGRRHHLTSGTWLACVKSGCSCALQSVPHALGPSLSKPGLSDTQHPCPIYALELDKPRLTTGGYCNQAEAETWKTHLRPAGVTHEQLKGLGVVWRRWQ